MANGGASYNHIPLHAPRDTLPAVHVRNMSGIGIDIRFADVPRNVLRVGFTPQGHPMFKGVSLYGSVRLGAAFGDRFLLQTEDAFESTCQTVKTWRSTWKRIPVRSETREAMDWDEAPRVTLEFPQNHLLIGLELFMNDEVAVSGGGRMMLLPSTRSVVGAKGALVMSEVDLGGERLIALDDASVILVGASGVDPRIQLAKDATVFLGASAMMHGAKVAAASAEQIAVRGTDVEWHSVPGQPPVILKDGHHGSLVRHAGLLDVSEQIREATRTVAAQVNEMAMTQSLGLQAP